jgi:exopolyphosphatase/guanosine-5'-triphosphate,3'-diphosphate pyrophosphatase
VSAKKGGEADLPRRRGRPRFPVRVAAIDVGSNAMRLLVVEVGAAGEYRVLENLRSPVRLGHGVYLTGQLSPSVTPKAVSVLKGYRERMRELSAETYRAVATSALRESANGESFLRRVRREAGLKLEVINGSEEARLVHRAVRQRVDLTRGRWLLADLGGGSVEVTLADTSGVLWTESHTMGSVRLLEELQESGEVPGRFQRLLAEYVETLRLSSAFLEEPIAGYVATGGNIETLAQMGQALAGADGVARLSLSALGRLIQQLSRLSYRERVEALGLREDRADVILPAALIYARLARFAGAREILVPFVGIKEGVVLDLADGFREPGGPPDRVERQVESSAVALGRKYRFDEAHGRHVARLALSLYDQLRAVHGLGAEERRVLHAASLLHDIGSYVSYSGHHKHSCYLLSHSNLAGFSPQQMALVANVARYHRRSAPKRQHEAYAALDRPSQGLVVKLAAFLRLADALDREHQQKVESVRAEVEGSTLKLWLAGEGDLLLESWSLKKKGDLLKSAFRFGVRVMANGKGVA